MTEENNKNNKVEFIGKVAKFPKNTKANKAYDYLHNLKDPKLSKKEVWYIMVETQGFDNEGNELQMVKYSMKKGVNLSKFLFDLKNYYLEKYKDDPYIVENITKLELFGDNKGCVSSIKNIPNCMVGDKKLITKITEDLIRLLAI